MVPLRFVLHPLVLLVLPWFGSSLRLGAPSGQIFDASSTSTTWNTLFEVATNLSSDGTTVSAEQLAFKLPLSTLTSSKPFLAMQQEAQSELLERIGELQFLHQRMPINFGRVQEFLEQSANVYGNPAAQFLSAALLHQHASSKNIDPAKSIVYFKFASQGSSLSAIMALGYRYRYGYNVPRSCESSMRYYRHAADRVIVDQTERNVLLPSQMFALPQPVRLSDNHHRSDHRTHPQRDQDDLDRAEYLRNRAHISGKPELMEQFASLALFSDLYCPRSSWRQLDSDGSDESVCTVRAKEAVDFLREAAKQGRYSAQALLGHVYAFSLAGVKQNVSRAIDLYEEALGMSRSVGAIAGEAANGLGLIYSNGLAGTTNTNAHRAMEYFKLAADAGLADGVYNTAVMLMDSFPDSARDYFTAAAQVGHLNSIYELARLKQRKLDEGVMMMNSEAECEHVVELYKQVAEHCTEMTMILDLALARFNDGIMDAALSLYQIAAEMGSEVAQSNAAWMLERFGHSESSGKEYLRLVSHAANQNSADAFIRLGDWKFARGNHKQAQEHYTEADNLSHGTSGRALYSIGYMNEHGLGGTLQSLERAALYYWFAGEAERVMWYPMAALQLKLRIQILANQLHEMGSSAWLTMAEWLGYARTDNSHQQPDETGEHSSALVSEVFDNQDVRELQTTEAENQVPNGSIHSKVSAVSFAAALQFRGPESQLDVELAPNQLLTGSQDFSVDSWLLIEANHRLPMILLDALNNFQVALVPDTNEPHAWIVQFQKLVSLQPGQAGTTAVFYKAHLHDRTWHHIALTLEAQAQTISLFINGQLRGVQLLRAPQLHGIDGISTQQTAASRLVAIGSSVSQQAADTRVEPFSGQLAHFRMWNALILREQISLLMFASEVEMKADKSMFVGDNLLIDLKYKVNPESTDATSSDAYLLNGDQVLPMASGIRLKMMRFPPNAQT